MFLVPIIAGCCIAFTSSWILYWMGLSAWRRSTGKHWTERARVLYPARVSGSVNVFLITGNVVLVELLIQPAFAACWRTLFLVTWLGAFLPTFLHQRSI